MNCKQGYPAQIEEHVKQTWSHQDWFRDAELEFVKSYYHYESHTIGMHSHSFYELNIVVEGNGRHYIESQSCDASIGCVFAIPPHIRHGYWTGSHLTIFHALISCTFFQHYAKELHNLPGCTILFEIEPYLRSSFDQALFLHLSDEQLESILPELERLNELEASRYEGCEVLKNAKLLSLIGLLSDLLSQTHLVYGKPRQESYSSFVIRTMEYIRLHYAEKLNASELARMCNLSRATYLRHFKAICCCTPQQYQTGCRLEKAKNLLLSSDRSISEISQECGFYDSSHFIRIFTKDTGTAPQQFRLKDSSKKAADL